MADVPFQAQGVRLWGFVATCAVQGARRGAFSYEVKVIGS